jgi:hypothetical protein
MGVDGGGGGGGGGDGDGTRRSAGYDAGDCDCSLLRQCPLGLDSNQPTIVA